MKTNEYDFNIYMPDMSMMTLVAYRYEYDATGSLSTHYQDYEVLQLPVNDKNEKAIWFLLNVAEETEPYAELDYWYGNRSVFVTPEAPDAVRNWVESLPEYEILGK